MTNSTPQGNNGELPDLPDFVTLAKILWLASKSRYHHVVLMALLMNELGIISQLVGLL